MTADHHIKVIRPFCFITSISKEAIPARCRIAPVTLSVSFHRYLTYAMVFNPLTESESALLIWWILIPLFALKPSL